MRGNQITLNEVLKSQGNQVIVFGGCEDQIFTVGERFFINDIGVFDILDGHENKRQYFEYVN